MVNFPGAGRLLAVFLVILLFPLFAFLALSAGQLLEYPRQDLPRQLGLMSRTLFLALLSWFLLLISAWWTGHFLAGILPRLPVLWAAIILFAVSFPLPILVMNYQLLADGLSAWGIPQLQPWRTGIWPAAVVHAVFGWPLVSLLVAYARQAVPQPLREEMQLLMASPWRREWNLLWECQWVFPLLLLLQLQTVSTEIVATDFAVYRTSAEEIYTASVLGLDVGRACLPGLIQVCLLLVLARQMLPKKGLPTTQWQDSGLTSRRSSRLCLSFACIGLIGFYTLPVIVTYWQRAGDAPLAILSNVWGTYRADWLISLMIALGVGVTAGFLGFVLATLGELYPTRWLAGVLLFLAFLPGPITGYAMKHFIDCLMRVEELIIPHGMIGPVRLWLYDGPSFWPVAITQVSHFLPFAYFLFWFQFRQIPDYAREEALLLSPRAFAMVRLLYRPYALPVMPVACLWLAALAFGEVSFSKMVQTPGRLLYSQELFNQMHYGPTGHILAMLLLQLFGHVVLIGVGIFLTGKFISTNAKST